MIFAGLREECVMGKGKPRFNVMNVCDCGRRGGNLSRGEVEAKTVRNEERFVERLEKTGKNGKGGDQVGVLHVQEKKGLAE